MGVHRAVLPIGEYGPYPERLRQHPAVATATSGVAPHDAGIASATVNTAQQTGSSIGTALLNTIAASATGTYLADHHGADVLRDATVHGYATAATWALGTGHWALGIMLGTAVLAALSITADPRNTTP
ncbi:hypothetical protein [Streptomyces canus]|uniref:hypothetical protein n=1 Tax=Streptomyces canus TaxID=58343 RepID=UPI002783AD8E|nr:hypothetical protein [Streptomyces canus]MDQ0758146.1 hypothetical protein [Streptomyces canus]